MEQWREIPEFEGLYEVSDRGRVRNTQTSLIRKFNRDRYGYLWLNLSKDGVQHFRQVHRLVGLAFLGIPDGGLEINHKNGKKTDNRLENLEWVTRSENRKHAHRVLGHYCAPTGICGKGMNNGYAKLTDQAVRQIRQRYKKGGITQEELARQFDVGHSTIQRVISGTHWSHVE